MGLKVSVSLTSIKAMKKVEYNFELTYVKSRLGGLNRKKLSIKIKINSKQKNQRFEIICANF
jgi:hypothetical protein